VKSEIGVSELEIEFVSFQTEAGERKGFILKHSGMNYTP
jgi:hypothetical protein